MAYNSLAEFLTATADVIRSKTGSTELITANDFPAAIEGISGGGGGEDAGWFNDGNTHIWISLPEGRTSPMMGLGVNGTVTVDWGDGTTPDTLTSTYAATSVAYTPAHNYASAGDYVITLTLVAGEYEIRGNTSGSQLLVAANSYNALNTAYHHCVKRVEIGGTASVGEYALRELMSLTDVAITSDTESIGSGAFYNCYSLTNLDIPDSVISIGANAFFNCYSLAGVKLPSALTSIGQQAFNKCYALAGNVSMPDTVTTMGTNAFLSCSSLKSARVSPNIDQSGSLFNSCSTLSEVVLPDGLKSVGTAMFNSCFCLMHIEIPKSVESIGGSAFYGCAGLKQVDFSKHTSVPALVGANAFYGAPTDFEIRVPAALVDEWKAATNWSTYADYIVGGVNHD